MTGERVLILEGSFYHKYDILNNVQFYMIYKILTVGVASLSWPHDKAYKQNKIFINSNIT
jgi:hypothetical protein